MEKRPNLIILNTFILLYKVDKNIRPLNVY